jgi:DNA-binding PadR family transcriptional regulator
MEIKQEKIDSLTLLLLYLNSWEEKDFTDPVRRAWKGHDFGALDRLEENGLITQSRKGKSLFITGEGIEKAKEFMQLLEEL